LTCGKPAIESISQVISKLPKTSQGIKDGTRTRLILGDTSEPITRLRIPLADMLEAFAVANYKCLLLAVTPVFELSLTFEGASFKLKSLGMDQAYKAVFERV